MLLSISNIAWNKSDDEYIYNKLSEYGFKGLEIAPTRIIEENPYDSISLAESWRRNLLDKYGINVSSMQSIWYGRNEKIFGTEEEREELVKYTMKAIDFASAISCKNMVFGCPRNRVISREEDYSTAVDFFRTIGNYACENGTVIAMEANPPIYNTNFINTTKEAIRLIRDVNSDGFLLNLDVGTMIANGERVDDLDDAIKYINHVHISEPGLKPIEKRQLHVELFDYLKQAEYSKYVSIEMGNIENIHTVENIMKYVEGLNTGK